MKLLILDTETTGLDISSGAKIIEIAAILYSVTHKTILQQVSFLKPCTDNLAYEVNRIPLEAANSVECIPLDASFTLLCAMAYDADFVVAHNAEFDKAFIDDITNKEHPLFEFMDKKWICTKQDFKWPIRDGSPLNLIHIAVELGVPVVSAHRALSDCTLIANCFDKLPDLKERIQNSLIERYAYQAILDYDNRQLAKDKGFTWDSEKRVWLKRMTEEEAALVKEFKVTKV